MLSFIFNISMCFGVCLVKVGASNDLGMEFTQSDSLLTNTFSLQIHHCNIMNSDVVLFASTVIVVVVIGYIDILRHADYDELIKYNLNVNTDRRFVPGTTLVSPRSNQAAC